MTENAKKKYDCATCPYPRYKEGTVIFCDVCMQKILDRKKENSDRRMGMSKEKRMAGSYEIEQSIYIGEKEVLFRVNKAEEYPFMVCYCSYNNPLSAPWCTEAIGTDDYLEAMQVFTDRVQAQIELVKTEQEQYRFDKTPFTVSDCIPDNHSSNIVGKVVVINAEPKRYEYQHAAYQLVLADGGHGATGGRGQAVFGTCLATGERGRWERYDVLGEIKPEKMPEWAKEALTKLKVQQKEKKTHSREER